MATPPRMTRQTFPVGMTARAYLFGVPFGLALVVALWAVEETLLWQWQPHYTSYLSPMGVLEAIVPAAAVYVGLTLGLAVDRRLTARRKPPEAA